MSLSFVVNTEQGEKTQRVKHVLSHCEICFCTITLSKHCVIKMEIIKMLSVDVDVCVPAGSQTPVVSVSGQQRLLLSSSSSSSSRSSSPASEEEDDSLFSEFPPVTATLIGLGLCFLALCCGTLSDCSVNSLMMETLRVKAVKPNPASGG